ncbi:3-dehydroquinate synthase [Sulfuriroseicoccus oceanibius]|uniref:3-dehydroquinate synthase n=1 Tax=Sulfuriroseicoccus oceanibius TaxID=2707525 RepID=A0A6B3L281_9BACT|nr:3-dehydroquinate synthase [Sulfuriroseicoccus oceanibius]QQL43813.1 3-dehydroquinate synthase [Sulfuriroseicoccus oceanibius]
MSFTTVNVGLDDRAYQISIGTNLLQSFPSLLQDTAIAGRTRCAVISDETVAALHADKVLTALADAGYSADLFTIKPGEASKSMDVISQVTSEMIVAGHDRRSFVVALGGGVVGDLAGFVAAIYYRGVPFVQLPTTIVAQVDSSVGGKTGVNAPEGKNLIGAFLQPQAVVADITALDTLGDREFNEGMAEAVKHGAIADPSLIDALLDLQRGDHAATESIIARNVAIKAKIVEQDELETSGTRAFLNFGHTIGHAIEAAAGYGAMFHGEAISLGIRAALWLSETKRGLAPEFSAKVLDALEHFQLPLQLEDKPEFSTDTLMTKLAKDKKFLDGGIRFVLLHAPGQPVLATDVTREDLEQAIELLRTPR